MIRTDGYTARFKANNPESYAASERIIFALFERRRELGLTQEEVGARMHVADTVICRWERRYAFPTLPYLIAWAEAVDFVTDDIIDLFASEADDVA